MRADLGALPGFRALSFAEVDTTYLRLLAAAKDAERDKTASPSKRAQAWRAVADYRGNNPNKEEALARAAEWERVIEAHRVRLAELRRVKGQWQKDRRKLDEILAIPDHTVPRPAKQAYQKEFKSIYSPWISEIEAMGAVAPEGFVEIPAGSFMMGSPDGEAGRGSDETRHKVTITRPYLLQATEVTQGQWREVMGTSPSHFKGCGDECPVETVNWWEAIAYLNKLSDREGLEACYVLSGCDGKRPGEGMECKDVTWKGLGCTGYRLPTEAEWEYAARAGTVTALYSGGLTIRGAYNGPELDDIAWYGGNSGVRYSGGYDCSGWDEKQYSSSTCGTHPVRKKRANVWGLYDMIGNVWEWTWDWKEDYSSGQVTDPVGPNSGSDRVYRGGSWSYDAGSCRAAYRDNSSPGYRFIILGFRPARSIP